MRKALRVTAIVITSLLLLVMLAMLWLTTNSGKNFLRLRAISFLEKKLNTDVHIARLDYKLPERVELWGVFFEDQKNDTILAARRMRVDIDMFKLLANQVEVNEIQIEGAISHLYRTAPDTAFNFDYVVKAFAAPPNPQAQDAPTDSTGQLKLNIHRLMLNDVYVRYDDYSGGDRFAFDIDTLNSSIAKVDPYSQDYRLNVLYIDGLRSNFIMDTSYIVKDVDTAARLPYLAANVIDINDVSFKFANNNDEVFFDLDIGRLYTRPEVIDLNGQVITANGLRIDSSSMVLAIGRKASAQASSPRTVPPPKWRIKADSLSLNDVDFKFDDNSRPYAGYGMDYAHLDFQNIILQALSPVYTTDTIAGTIRRLAVWEKSGFDVKDLRVQFMYHPEGAYLRNLHLQTSRSLIRDYAAISYPSLETLAADPNTLNIQADFKNSIVGVKDVLIFAPQLRKLPLFSKYENDQVHLTAAVTGSLREFDLKRVQLQGFDNTSIDVTGKLYNTADPQTMRYDLNIARLQSNETVLASFVPAASLKAIDLPTSFSASGKIIGDLRSFNADLVTTTSDGDATVKGSLVFGVTGRERYDMHIIANRLNIGKIAKQKDIGTISANVYAKGTGFDINYLNAVFSGDIHAATVLGYTYRNVKFNAKVANKTADLDVNSKDPNADLTFNGSVGFRNKYPTIVGRLVAANVNLQALKLHTEDLRIAGTFDADISSLNPDYPVGTVYANKPILTLNGERYVLDSVYVSSTPSADSGNYIVVNTGDIQAVISGHTPLTKIGSIVESHINRHYAISRADSIRAIRSAPSSYDLHVNAFIKNGPMIRALLPGLQSMDTARVVAGLTPNTMFLDADIPRVQYNNIFVHNGKARVRGDNTGLNYDVSVDRFQQGGMNFWYSTATGSVANQEITSKVSIGDEQRRQRFGVDFIFHQHPDKQEVHINPGLVLNYEPWNVSQPNAIVFSKDGFYVQNFRINSGNQSIALNSTAANYTAPIDVAINNFLMSNITEIMSADTTLVNGLINGKLTLRDLMKEPHIDGSLLVNNLSVRGDTIGDVNAQLNTATANKVDAKIAINGRGNDVQITGFYYPQAINGNNFDLNVRINTVNVRTMEGLTNYAIRNSVGNIRGDLKLTGTMTRPVVQGELVTDSLTTTIAMVGARFTMPQERIYFTPTGIEFDNFRLIDERGNAGLVDGKIFTADPRNLGLALRVNANRLMVLNTTAKDNELFYGQLLLSTNLRMSGSVLSPDIVGDVTVHDSTKMTVVVPQKQVKFQEREGIVEFVDLTDTGLYVLTTPTDTIERFLFRPGSYMNVNVTVEKEAEFSAIVDQGTGDFIRMKGEAALNTVMNPDGTIGITGTYTINQGAYELNYSFIKRRFDIQSGSTITFAGDPMHAQLNLKAIYQANVPPYELVERQVSEPTQLIYYRQRLPFQVHLDLQGDLMKPDILFNVVLPENRGYGVAGDVTSLVQAKLQQLRSNPSEMQKQVFAVLLLNRFVSDDPFESASGIDPGFIARQSVTRFISEQLNRFAGELIGGIDLTLDLQATEDYTTGQRRSRTDLNVTASKRLLNDRLKITIGNNFEMGGQNPNRNQSTSAIPGNIAADYELSRTGRYTVRIYRQTENEDLIRGYVTQTGATFVLNAEYNRFKNLFVSRKKQLRRREERQRQRQQQNQPQPPPNTTALK